MKIIFTGGGTGGHFYPIIAITQKLNKKIDEENIIGTKLYYFADDPYDKEMLFENGLMYESINTGKLRTYFSFKKFTDIIKTFFGVLNAVYKVFTIYPDVVFGKGGYSSFPTILAARILGIPVFIHESDSAPGRVNKWAGSFAKRIAVSFKDSAEFFPNERVAWTGQPIRTEIEQKGNYDKALDFFKIDSDLPVILILGGSQGAELINNVILDALPRLVKNFRVIHQTGVRNYKEVNGQADVVLLNDKNKSRCMSYAFLNQLQLKMAAGAASIIVSRAGSTIFEIASWGVPSILVPFTESNADHSKKNAFLYSKTGACVVVEEKNMTANILSSEIERIIEDKEIYNKMATNALAFNKNDAAEKIANELIELAMSHEK